jgi:hypothetical protein
VLVRDRPIAGGNQQHDGRDAHGERRRQQKGNAATASSIPAEESQERAPAWIPFHQRREL